MSESSEPLLKTTRPPGALDTGAGGRKTGFVGFQGPGVTEKSSLRVASSRPKSRVEGHSTEKGR